MDIGPNLTSVILQLFTLIGIFVSALFAYLTNRKAKALDTKVESVDHKVQEVAGDMQHRMIRAQSEAATAAGKAAQVAAEREAERVRAAARVVAANVAGVAQGRMQERAEEAIRQSGLMGLDPLDRTS